MKEDQQAAAVIPKEPTRNVETIVDVAGMYIIFSALVQRRNVVLCL